jgi:replicative DNA helicase
MPQLQNNLPYGLLPPQAKDMEEAVLGAILLERDAFDKVSAILKAECFYVTAHQTIFRAMQNLSVKSQPIDTLTVIEELKSMGEIEKVGGPYYVSKLTNSVVSSFHAEPHSRIILKKFTKRELIRIGAEMVGKAYEDETDGTELLDLAEKELTALRGLESSGYKEISTILFEAVRDLESIRHREAHLTGITTGFKDLDSVTCGWQPTDLIILAARPSVGKTAFMLNLARNAGVAVGIFSLEMSDRQLIHRMLSAESGVFMWNIKNGRLDDQQMKHLFETGVRPLSRAKIFVDGTPSIKLADLRSKGRRMVEKDGVKMILVDYLQLMRPDILNKGRRDLDVGDLSSGLKAMAKELNIPVIALSQLSRGVESRSDAEPKLSDLRDSGAIEQDADMVIFLWRPSDSEVADNPALSEVCNVKIEKHRNGTLETFLGDFKKDTQKWEDVKVLDKRTFKPIGESWRPYKEE